MATQLSFDHHFIYSNKDEGIKVPTILSFGGAVVLTEAYVDNGAQYCVFKNEVSLELGLDIESGIPMKMGPSSGGTIETFGHEVVIQTLEVAFETVIYFARYRGLQRNLLGRNGWLRFLRVTLIEYDNVFYHGKYDQ